MGRHNNFKRLEWRLIDEAHRDVARHLLRNDNVLIRSMGERAEDQTDFFPVKLEVVRVVCRWTFWFDGWLRGRRW